MNIKVQIKQNYGVDTVYPLCEKGRVFARIAGTKTLTEQTIKLMKQLGYTLELEAKTL